MLMVPEHHHLSLIKTHTVHDPASGRGATLSESPPSAPGTPDFTDYVEDGRLHSSCIDENFLNAATWSCQRHAQPQRSQQSQPLQYGKVTVSAGSTQLWPKASRQTSTAAFSPASEAASPDRAALQVRGTLSQCWQQHKPSTALFEESGPKHHEKPAYWSGPSAQKPWLKAVQPGCTTQPPEGCARNTVLLPSPKGTQKSQYASLELNTVLQLRILQRPSHGAMVEPVLRSGNSAEAPQAHRNGLRDCASTTQLTEFRLPGKDRQSFQQMKTATLKIQAAYRCHLQRQRFVCLKAAALKIQTAVRGHRLRQRFLMSKTAAIVVQRLFRVRVCCQRLRRYAIAAFTALQDYDNTRAMLTPVAQQMRQSSTNLALHLEGNADSAQWEALMRRNEATRSLGYHTTSQPEVVTHPQGTQEVEGVMEVELDSAVQEAPDLILPAVLEDVPIDGEDGQAFGAAERDLSHATQQAATAASASPEDMFDTQAWLRGEYEATFSTSPDSVSGLMAVIISAATFAASRLLKKLGRSRQKQNC
ncbi:hypothetical protein WJX77_004266 [Trebouxia sp. C0004]